MARPKRKRQHGSGQVVQPSTPGGTWGIRYRDGARRTYRGGFPSRDMAEAVLKKVAGDMVMGRAGLPPDPRSFPTLSEEAKDWLERRKLTHRAWLDDRIRWTKHLEPHFGHLRPAEVDAAGIRRFIEAKRASEVRPGKAMNPATVGACVRLLSTFFSDLCERSRQTGVSVNPVRSLPRSTRRLTRPTHDPRQTPFLRSLEDVRRVYQALPEGAIRVAFAIGAFGGLRPGEVLGLEWRDLDLERRLLSVERQVHESKIGPLKDDEARQVPVQDSLAPILAAWKLETGGDGLMLRTTRQKGGGRRRRLDGTPGAAPTFIRPHTLHKALRAALQACDLGQITWYQATRHTFASQWVMANGSMEKLAAILGHSSTEVTRRYAHLRTDLFGDKERSLLSVDLGRGPGKVVSLDLGQDLGNTQHAVAAK